MRQTVIIICAILIVLVSAPLLLKTVKGAQKMKQTNLPIRQPRHGGIYTVAHRGAHVGVPENTLAAYNKAIQLGVDFVEVDARTTKDGKIVSVHNETMESYNPGVKTAVRDLTLAEIKAIDVGSRVGPQFAGTQVPTLEEALDACKGKVGIYLDLKAASVEEIVKMIQARGMEHDVIWYATPDEIATMRKLCPECVEMPDPIEPAALPALLKNVKPRIVASDGGVLTEDFIKKCHEAGAIVICDEKDPKKDPGWWDRAIGWGLDGIQTDSPEELIRFLDQRKAPK